MANTAQIDRKILIPALFLVSAFLFILILLPSGASYGFQGGPCYGGGMGGRRGPVNFKRSGMGIMASKLDLSTEQINELKKMRMENFKEMVSVRKEMENPMLAAVSGGSFDGKVFEDISLKNFNIMVKVREKHMKEFFDLLTPAQKKEYADMLKTGRGSCGWFGPR